MLSQVTEMPQIRNNMSNIPNTHDFEILTQHLLFTYRQFCLDRIMHRKIKTELHRKFLITWNIILLSLENDFMIGIAKVFENDKYFKNIIRSRKHGNVINRIINLRHNVYAHFKILRNKQDFLITNKIKESEISTLFNTIILSVDQLKRNFSMDQDLRKLFIQVKEETQG